LFADDTSIITADPTPTGFTKNINQIISDINRWFVSNMLYLNYDKTYFMQFVTKKNKEIHMQVDFANKCITNISNTKFLGLTIDASMSWKDHIKELTTKLNKACYAIRLMKLTVFLNVLITIYCCYIHSAIPYGIIFWANSRYSSDIFTIQKRKIRVIMNLNKRDSCHELFKQLNILTL
jgi:hypothetical protein